MKPTLVALAIFTAVALALANTEEESDDVEIVLSDMPLKVVKNADLDGEHQANDLGYIILLVPFCEGTSI